MDQAYAPPPGGNRYRWVMLSLVWLIYFSFGLVTASMAPLLADVQDDLKISDALIGSSLAAWPLVYIFAAIPAGSLIERFGIKRSLVAAGAIMALSQLLRAMSFDYMSLTLAIALFGIGGPLISIGAPAAVAQWFEAHERPTALGIYTTAPVMGSTLALFSANAIVMPLTGYEWRLTLIVFGSVALLGAVACALFGREAPVRGDVASPASRGQFSRFRDLARIPSVQIVLLVSVGMFMFSHGSGNWLPELLRREGMSKSAAGIWAALPTLVGIAAALTLPRLAQRSEGRVFLILTAVFLSGSTAALLIPLTDGAPQTLGLILLGIGRSAPMPLMMLILLALPSVGPRNMGIAGGLFFTTGEIGGVLGPLLVGLIAQSQGLAGGYYMLAAVSLCLLLPIYVLKAAHSRETVLAPARR